MKSVLQWLVIVLIVLNGPMPRAFAHGATDGLGHHAAVAATPAESAAREHCAGTSAPAEQEQAAAADKAHDADPCHGGTCHCGCAGVTAVPLPGNTVVTDVAPEPVTCDDDASGPTGRVAAPFRPPSR